jgi:hypothetical protein
MTLSEKDIDRLVRSFGTSNLSVFDELFLLQVLEKRLNESGAGNFDLYLESVFNSELLINTGYRCNI